MQLNLILRRLIIVLGGLGLLILVGWFIWSRWPTTPTEPAPPLATDFFPGGEERLPPTKTGPDLLVDATSTPLAPNQVEPTGDRLYPVSAAPASNLVSAGAATGSPLIFADRATGNLYLTGGQEPSRRLSNTTVPGVREIYSAAGDSASSTFIIFRTLSEGPRTQTWLASTTLATSSALFSETSAPVSLDPRTVYPGLTKLAVAPDGRQLIYLTQDAAGAHTWLTTPKGGGTKEIFKSAAAEWQLSWPAKNLIALQTASSAALPGWLYFLDPTKKDFPVTEILGGFAGLTTLVSPDGKIVAFGATSGTGPVFGLYEVATKTFRRLPFTSLAEKCVFNKSGGVLYCAAPRNLEAAGLPDAWYRGETAWEDSLWKINPLTASAELIFSPNRNDADGVKIDAQNLILTPDEQTLYFLNRHDSRLWAFSVGGSF